MNRPILGSSTIAEAIRAKTNKEEIYKEKRYLRIFFEIHVVPRSPNLDKITPITLKRDESLGPEEFYTDPAEQKRMNFRQYESAYLDLLRQATELKSQLVEKYKGKNYSIYIISKKFKN